MLVMLVPMCEQYSLINCASVSMAKLLLIVEILGIYLQGSKHMYAGYGTVEVGRTALFRRDRGRACPCEAEGATLLLEAINKPGIRSAQVQRHAERKQRSSRRRSILHLLSNL